MVSQILFIQINENMSIPGVEYTCDCSYHRVCIFSRFQALKRCY